ncbi:MAG TPA: hypothetical protein VKA70_17495 [Blastocatellia bacterium]|nr:hypothetical protein [Blastocatellia bacterium]
MRAVFFILLFAVTLASAQDQPHRPHKDDSPAKQESRQALDKQIAAKFAPVFYQGLGDNPRSDYITNFDFDGDWKGDNNWRNLDERSFPLRAYIYYSVTETATHYFVHYAFFHPRDYKSGLAKTTIVDTLLGEGLRRASKDPPGGLANEIAMSHENDLEGCLVVAEKRGDKLTATVQFVETMAHNRFLKYCPREARSAACEPIQMEGERPLIFVEPRGHGPSRYTGDRQQLKKSISGVLVYRYTGSAEIHPEARGKNIGYDLIPIYDTFWVRAQKGEDETFGESFDYGARTLLKPHAGTAPEKIEQKLGVLGSAFRGEVGSKNKARPPWAWFDTRERDRLRGEWFFDPAAVIARHFNLRDGFSLAYVYNPYFEVR